MKRRRLPRCPECGATMRHMPGYSAIRQRGALYICPANEAELIPDANGRYRRKPGSRHQCLRIWSAGELALAHAQPTDNQAATATPGGVASPPSSD